MNQQEIDDLILTQDILGILSFARNGMELGLLSKRERESLGGLVVAVRGTARSVDREYLLVITLL